MISGFRAAGVAAAVRWRTAARSAGGPRIAYEVVLAGSMAAVTAAAGGLYGAPQWLVVTAVVATLVLVPLRLTHPNGALLGAAVVTVATGWYNLWFSGLIAASAGYRMTRPRRAAVTFLTATACWAAAAWLWLDARSLALEAVALALFAVVALVPAALAVLVGRRRRLIITMHRTNVQLHDQQAAIARQARDRERTLIARDLHDSLGHKLTLLSLYAGTLESAPPAQRAETLALLRDSSAAAMQELRQILGVLRQEDSGTAAGAQPLSSVDLLVESAASTGTAVTLSLTGPERPLAPLIEHAVYRLIQEGVTNALRHAGGAPVRVTLRYEPDAVVAEVLNGPGRSRVGVTSGLGLIGLTERIRLAGGVLHHGPTADRGFRVAAMLPYDARVPETGILGAGATNDSAAVDRGDFTDRMYRSVRRRRRWLTVLTAGLVVICGLGGAVFLVLDRWVAVDDSTFRTASVGEDEVSVRAQLPSPAVAQRAGPGAVSAPAGSTCLTYLATIGAQLRSGEGAGLVMYRFCFDRGVLVAKNVVQDSNAGTS